LILLCYCPQPVYKTGVLIMGPSDPELLMEALGPVGLTKVEIDSGEVP